MKHSEHEPIRSWGEPPELRDRPAINRQDPLGGAVEAVVLLSHPHHHPEPAGERDGARGYTRDETTALPLRAADGPGQATTPNSETRCLAQPASNAGQPSALMGSACPLDFTTPIGQETPVPWSGQ